MSSFKKLSAFLILMLSISPYALANPVSDGEMNAPFIFLAACFAGWDLFFFGLGGFFEIRRKRLNWGDSVYIAVLGLFAVAMLAYGLLWPVLVLLILILGTVHGVQMMMWGAIAWFRVERPSYLENAKPVRLIVGGLAGLCPLLVSIFLYTLIT